MMKPPKSDRRSPEQIAYDNANTAYQDAWKGDRKARTRRDTAAERLLAAETVSITAALPLLGAFFEARASLRDREARTAELLAAREGAHRRLNAVPG